MTGPGGEEVDFAPSDLHLIEKHGKYGWDRFEEHEGFHEHWWHRHQLPTNGSTYYFEVRLGGVEVARLQLVKGVSVDHYLDAPELGDAGLYIALMEVASDRRRQGTGRRVVSLLRGRYPTFRLFGFSKKGADGFWSSLGWDRYEHEGPARWRPLYIQPAPGG